MRAIVFNEVNKPLEISEMSKPTLGTDEVLVNIKAAAMNHRDVWITQGMYPGLKPGTTLGSCGAGLVGDREVIINPNVNWGANPDYPDHSKYTILGMPRNGTFSDWIAVHPDRLLDKPEHLSMEEAAALPLGGLTAYRALFTKGGLTAKKKVLISGIGGGVALQAFQFAVAIGAEVFVTSGSDEKIQKAIGLGAKGGANYKTEKWYKSFISEFGMVDLVIDSAGGKGYNDLLRVCNPRARIVNYGGTRGNCVINPQLLFWKELEIYGSTMGNDQEFQDMVELVNKHKIIPVVDAVYKLDNCNAAFTKMHEGKQFGKIVFSLQ